MPEEVNNNDKLTMSKVIQKARDDWALGKKNDAFNMAMNGLTLCSKGVSRLMHDVAALEKRFNDLEENHNRGQTEH